MVFLVRLPDSLMFLFDAIIGMDFKGANKIKFLLLLFWRKGGF
ncbi:hypothetical protein MNBD_ALPHA11-1610 [hydrothermal vent metagenome]|uniref:Uncharacterized protein n=1 Tax=hydrothermal vent metagenome TaxID=652676 RepID=A0A3B0TQ37_9ZZZZ